MTNKDIWCISKCLLGINCKYSGGNNLCPEAVELSKHVTYVAVCPEVEGGLPIPRIPAERQGDRVVNREGKDVSAEYQKGSEICLKQCLDAGVTKAFLKAYSPSCGGHGIYDGTFTHTRIPREGVFAEMLREHGIEITDETENRKGKKEND